METKIFKNKEDAIDFLQTKITNVNSIMESNLMVHEIIARRDFFYDGTEENIFSKMGSIAKNGLNVDYGSIYGTMVLHGDTKNPNTKELFEKFYHSYLAEGAFVKCLLVIPKYVNYQGEKIEFSTYKGQTSFNLHPDIEAVYKKNGGLPSRHDVKCCLLDVAKGVGSVSTSFILGFLVKSNKNEYVFFDPKTHYSNFSQEQLEDFESAIENKVEKVVNQYQTTDIPTIVVRSYLKDREYIESRIAEDI